MARSTISMLRSRRSKAILPAAACVLALLAIAALFTGRYPLTWQGVLSGDTQQMRIFMTLRLPRTLLAVCGGFVLGVCGHVYQTVFRNPLASPDVIGVSSGASAGAAAGILFFSGAAGVTLCAFGGALAAVVLALALSSLDRTGRGLSVVLAGVATHALAQTALMTLKLTADPERELAAIEYWIMGSLSGSKAGPLMFMLPLCLACTAALFLLHRQILLLSMDEGEARMLGVSVIRMRLVVLLVATLAVAGVISQTGLISFIGLLAPHASRLIFRRESRQSLLLSGLMGGILLCAADILARCAGTVELPVSIFTSLLGAPLLVHLLAQRRRQE